MALAIKPDYTDPWKGRGVALVELGRDAEVAVSCDKGLAINLDDASVWFIRGPNRVFSHGLRMPSHRSLIFVSAEEPTTDKKKKGISF